MAGGLGLTPEQREILLQALIQGGSSGMTDPALALQNIMQAQGGPSAAQAIVASLRNRLLPGAGSAGGPASTVSPALQAARGLSGEEPTYAKVDDRPGGILGEPKETAKKTDLDPAKVQEMAGKINTPAPTGNGILGDVRVPDVPDVPDAGSAVRSAVSGNLRAAARRGQGAMPSEREGPIAITETITKAALRHGVDPVGLIKTAGIESHFNPGAKNPKSSAGGLFQFIDSTAKSYGLRNKYDAAQSADAAARLWKDNKAQLTRSLGREPTNGELYLAHQQGPGGALAIIRNPNASVASTVGADAARHNGGAGMTNRQFANMWTRRMGGDPGTPQTAGQQAALLNEANQTGPADEGVPLPPRRPAELGGAPDLPTTEADLGPDLTEDGGNTPDLPTTDTDLGPDLTDGGIPDIGGLLGGLDTGDAGADEPSQFAQENAAEEAQEDKEPAKPIDPVEEKPGGILSGESLLGDQERTDLSRVFSPEGMGGTGLFGRDQGPDPTGFKAPVGLPGAGSAVGGPARPPASPGSGILAGTPASISSITPPQLRSIGTPAVPLPPPRPTGIDAPAAPSQLDAPMLPPPRPPGLGAPVPLPPIRPPDLTTSALPPPRPRGLLVDAPTGVTPNLTDNILKAPTGPVPPSGDRGLLVDVPKIGQPGTQFGAKPSLPAVDPDRMQRDPFPALASPPALDPDRMVRDPPWQDPPKQPGLLSTANPLGEPDDLFSRFAKGAGLLSGAFGQASSQMSPRKPPGSSPSRPIGVQEPLLTSGLLSNARQGIDLNRFFGLLSGRVI